MVIRNKRKRFGNLIIKGLSDYEYMEDAADIGFSWLDMVYEVYQQTGEMWEWYNVKEKSIKLASVENRAVLGWTARTYIALLDPLGLA
jgi:neutral trehalase